MDYKYSQVDKANLRWFQNDKAKATLLRMELQEGQLRGLNRFEMDFKYPISVIAGKNGSGKSTILALAACGYHNNNKDGFKLPSRKFPYYTFSDFFVQTDEEVPPEGIKIGYHILHDRWKKTQDLPDGIGVGHQARVKKKGGKWNKYSRRVKRDVVFFGIERVVPHSEKSVSRSYRRAFAETDRQGWEGSVRKVVSNILNSSYEAFWHKEYGKYHLPMVKARDTSIFVSEDYEHEIGEQSLFAIKDPHLLLASGLLVPHKDCFDILFL
jgi:energy-coupling factor transporter ATP-binding protein EcfA2